MDAWLILLSLIPVAFGMAGLWKARQEYNATTLDLALLAVLSVLQWMTRRMFCLFRAVDLAACEWRRVRTLEPLVCEFREDVNRERIACQAVVKRAGAQARPYGARVEQGPIFSLGEEA